MSDAKIIEGSAQFLCLAVELAMGRIDLCKCSKCGGPRDNGWGCGECEEGCCDPITEDCHADAAIHAVNSHDALTARVAELEAAINKMRSIVTDVQDGFEVVGPDAEILDLINETLEAKS